VSWLHVVTVNCTELQATNLLLLTNLQCVHGVNTGKPVACQKTRCPVLKELKVCVWFLL